MASDSLFTGAGWSTIPPDDLPAGKGFVQQSTEDDESAPNSPVAGSAPPPDLVAAFLQSVNAAGQQQEEHHADADEQQQHIRDASSAATALAPAPTAPPALRSSSINSDADGEALPNPFALQQQHPGGAATTHYPALPNFQQQLQQQQQGQQQRVRKQRTFLQRLLRGLMITGASAGLMALGAWGGSLAYRHYINTLDDRDQLARRVTDLHKQEEKLVLRCTALEQDRQTLAQQLSEASSALTDGAAARSRLQQQLTQANADREETVRLNLNLQRKLTTLEEQHSSLSAAHKEKCHALDLTLSEAARLDKEAAKLLGTVEKLESRCGALEAANVELKKENAAAATAAEKSAAQASKSKGAKC